MYFHGQCNTVLRKYVTLQHRGPENLVIGTEVRGIRICRRYLMPTRGLIDSHWMCVLLFKYCGRVSVAACQVLISYVRYAVRDVQNSVAQPCSLHFHTSRCTEIPFLFCSCYRAVDTAWIRSSDAILKSAGVVDLFLSSATFLSRETCSNLIFRARKWCTRWQERTSLCFVRFLLQLSCDIPSVHVSVHFSGQIFPVS